MFEFTDFVRFLHSAFPAVVCFTEHLAILDGRVATLRPRGDVVCFHFLEVPTLQEALIGAEGAHPLLPLIGAPLLAGCESANMQRTLVS